MLDPEAFLTELYVKVDDFDKTLPPEAVPPGPPPALARSEVVALVIFAQWAQFLSERAFYRYAAKHLHCVLSVLSQNRASTNIANADSTISLTSATAPDSSRPPNRVLSRSPHGPSTKSPSPLISKLIVCSNRSSHDFAFPTSLSWFNQYSPRATACLQNLPASPTGHSHSKKTLSPSLRKVT